MKMRPIDGDALTRDFESQQKIWFSRDEVLDLISDATTIADDISDFGNTWLIDGEKLMNSLNAWARSAEPTNKQQGISRELAIRECAVLKGVTKLIGQMENAKPVRHGRWVKMTGMMPPECHGHYECSECQWHMKGIRNSWTGEEEMSYCPNCGARMVKDD